ncbi:MAG: pyridoxal phosphate-dependent aminotransferase [Polyangiaceae bacterium]|nr:pyridoxal phosphate-dependent aminotransferase [Myxococcales bacterium]MCB9585939.1 pyridoxal phosphate-dependent aminotransferase [Polyangiaceae bacterium]MCB9607131.1 pyridoxal phosphate-dependent aminotransferase [Polyangiaceae bacterium]
MTRPSFSTRVSGEASPSSWALAVAEAQAHGGIRLDLTLSNPTRAGIEFPERLLQGLSDPRGNMYVPRALGEHATRRSVADLYNARGFAVRAEDVVLTASTSEAYAFLFKLFCDPGDRVLAPTPSYPLFEHLARLESVELEPYELTYDGDWHLAANALPSHSECVSMRIKLALAVSPNNPTGSCLSHEELARLAASAGVVVSDEVFASYPLTDQLLPSALDCDPSVPRVVLGGLSKELALPQLKLGWMILGGPEDFREATRQRLELICDTFLSVNTPVQLALNELIRAATPIRASIAERVQQNYASIRQALQSTSASLLRATGGWYACVRLPGTRDDEDWAMRLLQRGVLVQPGYFYDLGFPASIVLSLLTEPQDLDQGVRELCEALADV